MYLDIDGNKVFALSFGTGPRTFLAHSGWIGSFEDWIATLAPLSATWRTVVYDHRGAGETSVPVQRITPEALVDDVFAVMDRLQIETCVLAGFSRGTVTALRAVLKHPERFEGLVLMNGHGEVRSPAVAMQPRVAPSKWPGATHAEHLRWFVERCTPEPDVEHIRRWGNNLLSRASPEAAEKLFMMEPDEPIDWAAQLPRLQLPTLIVHGEHDAFCRAEHMQYMASLIPNSKLVVFEGSGHLPAMTRPLEVAREIDDFFAQQRPG